MSRIIILLILIAVSLVALIVYKITEKTNPCDDWQSVVLDNTQINEDGSVTAGGVTYQKDDYYLQGNTMRGCPCKKNSCVRKCCPLNQSYILEDKSKAKCVPTDKINFADELKYHEYIPGGTPIEVLQHKLTIINNEIKPHCKNEKAALYGFSDELLLTNGSVIINQGPNHSILLNISDYCVERIVGKADIYFVTCAEPESLDSYQEIKLKIFPICMLVTLPFLIVTFLVYFFISNLNNLVGKCLTCLTMAKIVSYLLLILVQLKGKSIGHFCTPVGYMVQYFLLSTFFWLNVMCFDICLVFRENRQRNMSKDEEFQKFWKYAVYAWGMAAIICVATYFGDKFLPTEYRPMIGEVYCLINAENKSRWIFYFLPLTVLLILNTLMFLTTAYKIFRLRRETSALQGPGIHITNKKEKERLNTYFKLFLVMGITWVAEPASSIFNEKPGWLWISLDALNLLLGIMIFIIFVCKKRTLSKIKARLYPLLHIMDSNDESRRAESRSTSSSSEPRDGKTIEKNLNDANNTEMIPAVHL